MSQFQQIKVIEVKKETADTVSVAFEAPNSFEYLSGQYITIKKEIDGEDIRRSYSLCSAPFENDFRVAVKEIANGKMSSFLNNDLKPGDVLDVMPPMGNFIINAEDNKHYIAFAAGSGITPVISMIKSVLKNTNSRFTLYYANKTDSSTIFKEELNQLQTIYPDNFTLNYVYTQQESPNKLFEGRITRAKFEEFVRQDMEILKADGFYMCGPEQMINDVSGGLEYLGVPKEKIHFELFTTPTVTGAEVEKNTPDFNGTAKMTVIMDGDEFDFELASDGDFILDAAMDQGVDAPFSCKGAVCCTCKAQVVEGKAVMEMNYALSDEEVEQGFILTCQSHPASENVVVDFDVI